MSEITLPTLTPRGDRSMRMAGPAEACYACGSCVGRRDFVLKGLGALVAAAVMGTLPRSLAAQPIRWIQGTGSGSARRYPVPTEDGVHVDRAAGIIVVRYQGDLAAFSLACPHQHAMLKWLPSDDVFECTKHHSKYSPMGVYIKGRATRNMDRLAISVVGDQLVVDPGTLYKSDKDPSGWAAAVIQVS
jgi:nitrite reductase/ring-hydroxylating ferredoxin subunit